MNWLEIMLASFLKVQRPTYRMPPSCNFKVCRIIPEISVVSVVCQNKDIAKYERLSLKVCFRVYCDYQSHLVKHFCLYSLGYSETSRCNGSPIVEERSKQTCNYE